MKETTYINTIVVLALISIAGISFSIDAYLGEEGNITNKELEFIAKSFYDAGMVRGANTDISDARFRAMYGWSDFDEFYRLINEMAEDK